MSIAMRMRGDGPIIPIPAAGDRPARRRPLPRAHRGGAPRDAASILGSMPRAPAPAASEPARVAGPGAPPPDPGPYGPVGRSAWLDVDWPAHRRWVEMDGRRVNVVELGAGDRTIVFVHGLAGSWQNWLENLPVLADLGYRVVTVEIDEFEKLEAGVTCLSVRVR